MLTCWNSPLWQCCECCNNVLSSFWPPWLVRTRSIEQRGHHVTCVNNKPQVSSLHLYEKPSALNDVWVQAGGCKRSLPRVRLPLDYNRKITATITTKTTMTTTLTTTMTTTLSTTTTTMTMSVTTTTTTIIYPLSTQLIRTMIVIGASPTQKCSHMSHVCLSVCLSVLL